MDKRLRGTETRSLRSIHYSSVEGACTSSRFLGVSAKPETTSYSAEKRSSRQPLHVNSLMSAGRSWNISRKLAYEIRNAQRHIQRSWLCEITANWEDSSAASYPFSTTLHLCGYLFLFAIKIKKYCHFKCVCLKGHFVNILEYTSI